MNRAIECLNGGVASGGCVCRYKGLGPGSRRVGGVQLVAAILVMYPWGRVKVLSARARRCILHSTPSFLGVRHGGGSGRRWMEEGGYKRR